jgi:hypothetical protein
MTATGVCAKEALKSAEGEYRKCEMFCEDELDREEALFKIRLRIFGRSEEGNRRV